MLNGGTRRALAAKRRHKKARHSRAGKAKLGNQSRLSADGTGFVTASEDNPWRDEHPGKMVLAKTRDHFGFAEACLSYRSRSRREILVISQLKIARARRDVAESRVSRHPHTYHLASEDVAGRLFEFALLGFVIAQLQRFLNQLVEGAAGYGNSMPSGRSIPRDSSMQNWIITVLHYPAGGSRIRK
jgi:hypothetical protein